MDPTRGVLLQKLGDGALGISRLEQFQVHLAAGEKGGLHFLGRHFLEVLALQALSLIHI